MSDGREVADGLYAALRAGDAAALKTLLDPDFVGHAAIGMPLGLGGDHVGPDAMRDDFWWQLGRSFEVGAEPAEMHELSDGRLLVTGTYVGRARRSGRPLSASFTHVLTFRDGRISDLVQLTDTAAWHDALNLPTRLETIEYTVSEGLATICLDRPQAHNAIDLRLASEMLDVARRVQSDQSVRAVLICGNGPDLTVGGDIAYISGSDAEIGALLAQMTTPWHEAFVVLSRLDVPIVTAVQGSVAGGGLGLVYAADITIAADDARFVTAFAGLGLSGDGGGTYHLPRRIGAARAAQVYLENTPIQATDALAWGLVNELVPPDEVRARAEERATRLAHGPTRGYGAMRRLLRESWDRTLPDQLRAETETLSETARSRDTTRALAAFTARQRPTYEGA